MAGRALAQQLVQRSLVRALVEEIRVAHLDRVLELAGQLAQEAAQHVHLRCAKARTELDHERPQALRQRRHQLEEAMGFRARMAQHQAVGDIAGELEAEAEVLRGLCAPAVHGGRTRQGVEAGVALDGGEDFRILPQVVLALGVVLN